MNDFFERKDWDVYIAKNWPDLSISSKGKIFDSFKLESQKIKNLFLIEMLKLEDIHYISLATKFGADISTSITGLPGGYACFNLVENILVFVHLLESFQFPDDILADQVYRKTEKQQLQIMLLFLMKIKDPNTTINFISLETAVRKNNDLILAFIQQKRKFSANEIEELLKTAEMYNSARCSNFLKELKNQI